MSWWFHLLVRRVEALKERAQLAERLFRAVGTFRYAERAEMILVDFEVDPYHRLFTIGKVYRCRVRRSREEDFFKTVTSPCDAPAVLYAGGSLDWRRNGKVFREPGKPSAMLVDGFLYYSAPRSDGDGYVACEWSVGADEMYRLLREGFK